MKKETKTELTKEKIMFLAMEEFGTRGYTDGSLNNICNAGIAKGLLYHNFKNKDALYLACVERSFSKWTAYIDKQEFGTDLCLYMEARLRFFHENKQEAHLFFEATLWPPAHLKEKINELRHDLDMFNYKLYKKKLNEINLHKGISEEDGMQYLILMQKMFNGYFSSPAICDMSFSKRVEMHEMWLPKLFDFMLYGIAGKEV